MAGNESLTEKSAKILLERGLVQVEGGKFSSFSFHVFFPQNAEGVTDFSVTGVVFSRDMRIHLVCYSSVLSFHTLCS